MSKKVQDTSKEAFYSLDPEMLVGLRKKIFKALQEIGAGHYEDIAKQAGIDPMKCWKRLSELMTDGLIHRTGDRKMLSSKRAGSVWAIGPSSKTVKRRERVMKGPTIVDYSKSILNQPKLNQQNTERLF